MDYQRFCWLVILSVLHQVGAQRLLQDHDGIKTKPDATVHLRMRKDDLERHFGVSSHDDVPEYEITHPFQVDDTGEFISHILDTPKRRRRDLNQPNVRLYKLQAFGMSLHLNLSKNEGLISPGMTVEKHENGTISQEHLPENSFYHGHVTSHPGSLVALSNDAGLAGIIRLLDQTFFVQPLDKHFASDDASKGLPHLVYKRSLEHELAENGYLQDVDEGERFVADPKSTGKKRVKTKKKAEKNRGDGEKYLEMTLVADQYTIAFHKENTTTFLLMLANLLNTIYHDESIGAKKITISVVQIKLVKDFGYQANAGNREKISALNNWRKKPSSNIPASDSHPLHPDVLALVSRGSIGGLASFGTRCSGSSTSVSNDIGLASALILAHETAHNLGVDHDTTPKCPNQVFVMSTVVTSGKNAMRWSPCSRYVIQTFLSEDASACLNDKPRKSLNYLKYFNKGLPGESIDGHQQCKLLYGEKYFQCKYKVSTCGSLYCSPDDYSCISKAAPPLDGTYCGVGQHCIKGDCVDAGRAVIHGSWSKWGSYSKCSRTCGNGVQYRTRTCTKPPPKNGGDNCEGESKGFYRICNTKPCPENTEDYRTFQCKRFGEHLHGLHRSHAVCQLFCRSGYTYSPKGMVADGTRCYNDPNKKDICLANKCLRVGCDNVIGSTATHDRCGKCNGDSTKCVKVVNTYTKSDQMWGVDNADLMFVVPKGSTAIWVYNMAITRNSIGIQDTNKKYLISLPSRSRTISAAGTQIKYQRSRGKHEFIHIVGPTNQPLRFMYVYFESKMGKPNAGIKYQFLKKGKSSISPKDVEWRIQSDWSDCSESCAGGTKTRVLRCIRKDDKTAVSEKVCENGPSKPVSQIECNTQPCPKEWHLTDWTTCSKTCGPGTRTRQLSCRQKVKNPGEYRTVFGCNSGTKPALLKKACFQGNCPAEWMPSQWSECSKTCGGGGVSTRTLTCKRLANDGKLTPVPSGLCKRAVKPTVRQQCNEDRPCPGKRSYRSLGCYRERRSEPLLPHLVRNLRSSIRWSAMKRTVEGCYQHVKDSRYEVFGVKFYGECWAGKKPEDEFKAERDECMDDAVGKSNSYYVYEIE